MRWGWRPYVSVAQRRRNAEKQLGQMRKKGRVISPIRIEGRTIARTFWGKAWCDHLESYSDFENRLPRGRTYVRNGSVVDLQISQGTIHAMVSGSELYNATVRIKTLNASKWNNLQSQCVGKIDSLVELLQGKFSDHVMRIITQPESGLFPMPSEISLECSCPDWADLCKHLAAVLYGIGARLDENPELLFLLRGVDHLELVSNAGAGEKLVGPGKGKKLAEANLSDVFGVDIDPDDEPRKPSRSSKRNHATPAKKAAPGKISKTRVAPASKAKRKKKSAANASQARYQRVSLKEAVRQALESSTEPLTKSELLNAVESSGYPFRTANPLLSLNTVLYSNRMMFRNEGGRFSLRK